MMYDDDREGMLEEYAEKCASECGIDTRTDKGKMNIHFLRGYISQVIDRVREDPEKYGY